MPVDKSADAVRLSLARAVAGRKVDPKAVKAVATRLGKLDYRIRGINPCIYGICLDFILERPELDKLVEQLGGAGRIRGLHAFPWGIPWPDLYHVRVEQQFDELPDGNINLPELPGPTEGFL